MKNSEFITGKVPITKEEVRAISLSKLELNKKSIFVDIGSGTGSVTVEAAINYPNLKVYSIEKNEDAYNLTKENINKFNLKNVVQFKGEAPLELGLKENEIDGIFLGGTGENIREIIEYYYKFMKEKALIVSNFILIENFNSCLEIFKEFNFKDIEASQVYVSKLEKLGKGSFFKPNNPIFIISAKK